MTGPMIPSLYQRLSDDRSQRVQVLLATYNAGPFLAEQVRSLLEQDYPELEILARDDGSTDGTAQTLRALEADHGGRLVVLDEPGHRLGVTGNFASLLAISDAPYVMFCDQDDVWLPEKVKVTLAEMQACEGDESPDTPILVHTDLRVVDERLRSLGESFVAHRRIDPAATQLRRILAANVATGCTMMMNRALVALASPIPDAAALHDHWVALVASVLGKVRYLPTPTVLYRQHGTNVVGAPRRSTLSLVEGGLRLVLSPRSAVHWYRDQRASLSRTQAQARVFLSRYGTLLSAQQSALVQTYGTLPSRGFLTRRLLLVRHAFWRPGLGRRLGMMIYA